MLVGLVIMAEIVVMVSSRGHIDWHTSFGPKDRRKRQSRTFIFFTFST